MCTEKENCSQHDHTVLKTFHCEITIKAVQVDHCYKKQLGGVGQPGEAYTTTEFHHEGTFEFKNHKALGKGDTAANFKIKEEHDSLRGGKSQPHLVTAGGVTDVCPTFVTSKGTTEKTDEGLSMGLHVCDTCAATHDGKTYLADLNETLPKSVVCNVPKEVPCNVGFKTTELTHNAEASALSDHTGVATLDSQNCCVTTVGTELDKGPDCSNVMALSVESHCHLMISLLSMLGLVIHLTKPLLHEQALVDAQDKSSKVHIDIDEEQVLVEK